jgi:hypothetical protein
MFGLNRDAMIGRPYSAFLHPEDAAATQAEVERVVRLRGRGGVENRQRTTEAGAGSHGKAARSPTTRVRPSRCKPSAAT